ncbi:radical SAM protein [Alkaliphilus transvaalensis]|uniref:radical SAM protein n=1 Tax=Alkaliphilus transvaalensis TaxID=114628 RepID=UPI00047BD9FB|nr:radical SAM protein [Alkaliphilus transvaalensis]
MTNLNHKEVTLEYFKSLWLSKKWNEGDKFNLYVDGPFCAQRCNFCIHYGDKVAINSPIYNKYYKEYMPYLLKEYEDIINLRVADSIYFGGGTANLMTAEIMRDIFSRIPNMKKIPYKVIEGHPAFMTKEKLDILKEYNFSYISLGLQTLDNDLLKRKNRIPHNPTKLKELIRYCQDELDIHVNCDLLTFIDKGTVDDVEILTRDIKLLMEEYKPNLITIYPEYQGFSGGNYTDFSSYTEEEKLDGIEKIRCLRKGIMRQVRKVQDYNILKSGQIRLHDEDILSNILDDYYIGRFTVEEFQHFHKFSCSSYPWHLQDQNVLGIGGYGRRQPYSYLGRQHYFNLENRDWQPVMREVL